MCSKGTQPNPLVIGEEQLEAILQEIRWGLMLEEMPEQMDHDTELTVFEKIAALFDEARRGCYFCDGNIDPNSTEFNYKTALCLACQFKLANFMTALGFDPVGLFPLVQTPRTVQRTRIGTRSLKDDKQPTFH